MIHPTAIIEDGAQIGAGCEIMAHAVVTRHAILGDGVVVHPGAVVGGDPQFLKFDRKTPSFVRIGAGAVLRENTTVNRSIHAGQATELGARCFMMANSHVGHDCVVGDDVVLANNAMLAGHVTVGAASFIGGGAGVHQFCRVGELCMVAGLARIALDLAPFTMSAERNEVIGLNLVGLKRRGVIREDMRELKAAFAAVYANAASRNLGVNAAAALGGGGFTSEVARQFLGFFAGGKRGYARLRRDAVEGAHHAG